MRTYKGKLGNGWVFLWLALILICVYSNGMDGVWFGGDHGKILNNRDLHMETFSMGDLAWAASSGAGFSGALPNVSFALNWWYSGERAAGYHFTNYVLHLLAAFLLFLTIKQLWYAPRLQGALTGEKQIRAMAFAAALLWALHPVQVDSVTYIIQRTTVMTGMFMLLGLYGFTRAKMARTGAGKIGGAVVCLAGFAGAALSKENAIIFPLILLLTYGVFFMGPATPRRHKIWLWGLAALWSVIGLLAAAFFMAGLGQDVYAGLYFSPWERLLTQSRVLFYYLYLIFWPLPSHFQIEHFLPLSTSLISPVTTLLAVAGIIALVGGALRYVRRWPWVSFAVLFFFIGHVVESTVLPLDLISEHRNYFPAMFLGAPFAYGAVWLYNRGGRPEARRLIIGLGVLLPVLFGFSTYLRNFIWQDEVTLYEAALERDSRINATYARFGFYWSSFDDPQSISATVWLLERAYDKKTFLRPNEAMQVDFTLGSAYLKAGRYDLAIAVTKDNIIRYADNAAIFDNWLTARRFLGHIYMEMGDLELAETYFAKLAGEYPDNPEINFDYGNVLFLNGGKPESRPFLEKAYAALPMDSPNWTADNTDTLCYNLALLSMAAGDYDVAATYWQAIWQNSRGEKKPDAALFLVMLARDMDEETAQACLDYLTLLPYKIVLDKFTAICHNENIEPELKSRLSERLNRTLDFIQ